MDDSKQINLPDGRALGYGIFGSVTGRPVFFNHGWPSSRFEAEFMAPAANALDIALISIDRPGYGLSDFKAGRTILDWPDDLVALADHLNLDRFPVIGVSGGGPYVAAAAYKIPERLSGAAIVAGITEMTNPRTREGMRLMNRFLLSIGPRFPRLLKLVMRITRSAVQNPKSLERAMRDLPDVDKAVLSGNAGLMRAAQESFRQGTEGATHGGILYAQDWGFDLKDIEMPVSIWQGTLDVNVPPSNGQILVEEIPNAVPHIIPGEGHFSLIAKYREDILAELIAGRL